MVTVLQHGMLIDGIASEPTQDGMLAFEGSTILYAGPYDPQIVAQHPDAKIVDTAGKTIMPGLINAHVHLTYEGKFENITESLMESATYSTLKAAANAKKHLDSGFTTIRCMGEKAGVDIAVKQAVGEGMIEGPRIIASGKAISMTGGAGDFIPDGIRIDCISETADGPDEMRRAARERLKYGVDNIKLMATGGGNSTGPQDAAQFTVEEMKVVVEEAENRNVCTGAHCIGVEGIKRCLKAGVRTIEHGTFIDDEGVQLMLQGEHYLCPTLLPFLILTEASGPGTPYEAFGPAFSAFNDISVAGATKAYEAGVKIIFGTDTGTPFNYHGAAARELEALEGIGMSPMEVIQSATSVAAEALRQSDIGALAKGKTADVLIVDGDPLANIGLLKDEEKFTVIHNGNKVVRGRL